MTYVKFPPSLAAQQQLMREEMFDDPMEGVSNSKSQGLAGTGKRPPEDHQNYVAFFFDDGQKPNIIVQGVEAKAYFEKIQWALRNEKRHRRKRDFMPSESLHPSASKAIACRTRISNQTLRSQYEPSTTPEQRPSKRSKQIKDASPTGSTQVGSASKTNANSITINEGVPKKLSIELHDVAAQKKWFGDAFKAVQQVGCRLIAKLWIKKIHPKKQSTHPYNGAHPRDLPPDPDRTKPPYWPTEVKHKEPDHIDRTARTALLVHLIMHTPQNHISGDTSHPEGLLAEDLRTALLEKKAEFKGERWQIIEEIIKARSWIERYERGEYDGTATMYVPDYRVPGQEDSEENDLEVVKNEELAEPDDDQQKLWEDIPTRMVKSSPSSSTVSLSQCQELNNEIRQLSDEHWCQFEEDNDSYSLMGMGENNSKKTSTLKHATMTRRHNPRRALPQLVPIATDFHPAFQHDLHIMDTQHYREQLGAGNQNYLLAYQLNPQPYYPAVNEVSSDQMIPMNMIQTSVSTPDEVQRASHQFLRGGQYHDTPQNASPAEYPVYQTYNSLIGDQYAYQSPPFPLQSARTGHQANNDSYSSSFNTSF